MSEYTVKSGDNLWNICKKQFKLSSNAEIAKKVNEVAKNNGISNPNLIFAGKSLKIGDAMDTIEKTPAENNPVKENEPKELTKPQKAADERIANNDLKTYEDLNKLAHSTVSLFSEDIKTNEQKKQAYTQYSERLLKEYYDIDKDGKVTQEEFAQVESKGSEKALKIQQEALKLEDSEIDNVIAHRTANLFANNLDMNADGIISTEELAFFNKNADEVDGKVDGVIKNAGESSMFAAVTGMNASDKEINRVVNKYLLGENLTAEEQKILEQSTTTIRNNMRKAAGL